MRVLDKPFFLYYTCNTEVAMTTVRLPVEYEQRLNFLSTVKKKNKSDLIKEALDMLFHNEEMEIDSYELGKEYFGKYGSGNSSLSVSYKQKIKDFLHGKLKIENIFKKRFK